MLLFALFFSVALSAKESKPSVPPEIIKEAKKIKSLADLQVKKAGWTKNLIGLYNSQLPNEIEWVGGAVVNEKTAISHVQYKNENIILGESFVGYYPKENAAVILGGSQNALFEIVDVLRLEKLSSKQWVHMGCYFGNERVAGVVGKNKLKSNSDWHPDKAWRFDESIKKFVPLKSKDVICENDGDGV